MICVFEVPELVLGEAEVIFGVAEVIFGSAGVCIRELVFGGVLKELLLKLQRGQKESWQRRS